MIVNSGGCKNYMRILDFAKLSFYALILIDIKKVARNIVHHLDIVQQVPFIFKQMNSIVV